MRSFVHSAQRAVQARTTRSRAARFAVAVRSHGARRAPVVLVRVPSVLLNGQAVALSLVRTLVPMRSRCLSKVIKLAMRSALSAKLADNEFVVVDSITFDKPSTKEAAAILAKLGLDGKRITLILEDDNVNGYLSFRNIPGVRVLAASELNTYDFIDNKALVVTSAVLDRIEEVLA